MTTSRSSGSEPPARRGGGPLGSDQDPLARAKALALRYLAANARSEAQVRARLAKAELADQAELVVAWLIQLRYLDDERYALARARGLTAPGKLGPRAAERRLLAAGVAPATARGAVAAALAEAPGGEVARCRELAARRARGQPLSGLDERTRARLARFLLGRGFAGAVVARTLGGFADRELDEA
jgi:regulatory protein